MTRPSAESGMTLIVGLIMLALMTVMAISSFNIGRISMEIIGNMQQRNEVTAAANGAIQEAVSTTRLMNSPGTIFLNPCSGNNTRCVDTNGDGTNDVTVTLTPVPGCVMAQPIPNAALSLTGANNQTECAVQVNQASFGISGSVSGNSLCATSMWEVTAVAVDSITEATVTVTQGVAVTASTANIATSCPGAAGSGT